MKSINSFINNYKCYTFNMLMTKLLKMAYTKSNSDDLLFEEVRNGNQKVFRKLFDMHWESMFCLAKSILIEEHIAKDVVQDFWLNLWIKRKSLNIKNFEAYIYKSVKYGCFKYLRDNKFNVLQISTVRSLEFAVGSDIENQHSLDETRHIIENSLNPLSPRCKKIFKMSRFEAFSNEEIASELGISKRSVENQLSLALKSIRLKLTLLQSFLTILLTFLGKI
ncbi:hypothetical protein LCGC14_1038960 [marine sediment metagenome]